MMYVLYSMMYVLYNMTHVMYSVIYYVLYRMIDYVLYRMIDYVLYSVMFVLYNTVYHVVGDSLYRKFSPLMSISGLRINTHFGQLIDKPSSGTFHITEHCCLVALLKSQFIFYYISSHYILK